MAIIFNEDPNHYIFTRFQSGKEHVTEADLRAFIRQYRGTNISDFLVCVNAGMPFYPTKSLPSAIDRLNEWEKSGRLCREKHNAVAGCVRLLRNIYADGLNMNAIWLDEIRACGMRAWVSVRMNDIHDAENPDAFLPSDFYKSHPEAHRVTYRKPAIHPEYALDYSVPAVREHYLTLIKETLETFDCDGIELDYMREPYCFAIGREQTGLAVMSDFIGEVVSLVRAAEKRGGHKILIGARVPDSPRNALLLGLDAVTWVHRGYLDRLFVTPHWSSSDSNMPIDLWKSILGGKNVRLAAGLEILLDAYNRPGRKYKNIDLRSAVGFSCAYRSLGADDIYLFNYMDSLTPSGVPDVFSGDGYQTLMQTIGNEDRMIAAPRRNVVTFGDTWIPGERPRKVLPLRISDASAPEALRIPTGPIPAGRTVTVRLGLEKGTAAGNDLTVWANCRACRPLGKTEADYPAYEDMDYYAYAIENDGRLPTVFTVEVAALHGTATVHWAEITID
ncbi:MAG: hypothetical protein KBS76_06260 [Ruminococcus sp.]|nr:hypothetical protein [Candidatus Apopatosoma intestinale]